MCRSVRARRRDTKRLAVRQLGFAEYYGDQGVEWDVDGHPARDGSCRDLPPVTRGSNSSTGSRCDHHERHVRLRHGPEGFTEPAPVRGHGPRTSFLVTTAVEENGTCDASCSLREAIDAANLRSGLDRIFFAIPGPAPVTITPASTLPAIESPVIIDATLQSGYVGNPLVELDGGSAPSSAAGLSIGVDGSGSTIRGLAIGHFGVGIEFESASSANVLEANYIGVGASGSTAAGNELGIFSYGSNNRIGGTSPGARNIISGNQAGVRDFGADNTIQGNYIGLDATGTVALPNGDGLDLLGSRDVVGGAGVGAGNVISGNTQAGVVLIGADHSTVQGNLIGTTASGSAPLGNGYGMTITSGAQDNLIGGSAPVPGT